MPILRDKLKTQSELSSTGDESANSSSDDSSDEEVVELPVTKTFAARKPRTSVSAEAFGVWNKKEEFKAPFYSKTEETKEALKNRLETAFMFSALNP